MTTYYPAIGSSGNRMKPLYGYGPYSSYLQSYPFTIATRGSSDGRLNKPENSSNTDVNSASVPREVSGGITAVMEYKPQNMADFLSWCALGILKQGRNASSEFKQAISSILQATRLPRATIVIGLEYINQRFGSFVASDVSVLTDNEVFLRIIVALVLANKFNDDNTFTNRSWSGATGLCVEILNKEEAAWLKAIGWNLNVVSLRANIDCLEQCWNTWMSQYSTSKLFNGVTYTPAFVPYSPYPSVSAFPTPYLTSYSLGFTPSSPLCHYGLVQLSASSPLEICDSRAKFSYDWQNSRFNWGYVYGNMFLRPPVHANVPVGRHSFGNDFYKHRPNYYKSMASC